MAENKAIPTTNLFDLLRLLLSILSAYLRNPRAFKLIDPLDACLRRGMAAYGPVFYIRVFRLKWLFVNDEDFARRMLEPDPHSSGFTAGRTRRNAMDAMAPEALTALNDKPWRQMRDFNTAVLTPDQMPQGDARFLRSVETAFPAPVENFDAIKKGMGQVMLAVVFGEREADEKLPVLIDQLMDRVENPIRRRLCKRSIAEKRGALYDQLRAHWRMDPPADASLVSLGRRHAADAPECRHLDQIPHWMFTFVRSGSQWIARSLALILSSPEAYRRCCDEAVKAWPEGGVDGAQTLDYIQACMVETARLYPPVQWTFHQCPDGTDYEGGPIEAGTEILQVFTLWHRQRTGEIFKPENAMKQPDGYSVPDPLFLGGARYCPGRTLIQRLGAFTIARQLATHHLPQQAVVPMDDLPFAIRDERLVFSRT
ncbi:cytochrome P450 [Pontiella sp.]|uniref:cytochrome P450 n=1 Tax=Pontiella sp. TaxID=2837462 RepID=UPI0035667872